MTKQLICNESNFKVDMVKGGNFMLDVISKKYYWIITVDDSNSFTTEYVGFIRNTWYRFKFWVVQKYKEIKKI